MNLDCRRLGSSSIRYRHESVGGKICCLNPDELSGARDVLSKIPPLMTRKAIQEVFSICKKKILFLDMQIIAGYLNVVADALSRNKIIPGEWRYISSIG